MDTTEVNNDDNIQLNGFKLFMLLFAQYIFFGLLNYCLYPPDQPPKMRMTKLESDLNRSRLTGETRRPITRLLNREIALLSNYNHTTPFSERSFLLTEQEQVIMAILRDGEINYLKDKTQLFKDQPLNYGNLVLKRASADYQIAKNAREMIEMPAEAVVETLTPLKRFKDLEKEKKKRNKDRADAMNKLARGNSLERTTYLKRIMADRQGIPRKVPPKNTVEDGLLDPKKKLKSAKGFRNLIANETTSAMSSDEIKRRKSMMLPKTSPENTPTQPPQPVPVAPGVEAKTARKPVI